MEKEFKIEIEKVDYDTKERFDIKKPDILRILVAPQNAVTAPTGGGSAGVDQPARDAINDLILKLQNMGLLK
jgi:hypothetical protein